MVQLRLKRPSFWTLILSGFLVIALLAFSGWWQVPGASPTTSAKLPSIPSAFEWQSHGTPVLLDQLIDGREAAAIDTTTYAVQNGALIGMGGNLPGGQTGYSDSIRSWPLSGAGEARRSPLRLTRPRGHIGSARGKLGLYALGGQDGSGPSSVAELVVLDSRGRPQMVGKLPALPKPATNPGVAILGDKLIVAASADDVFAFDLTAILVDAADRAKIKAGSVMIASGRAEWHRFAALPVSVTEATDCGPVRLTTQYDGQGERLFAFCQTGSGQPRLLTWAWHPAGEGVAEGWRKKNSVRLNQFAGDFRLTLAAAHGQANVVAFFARPPGCVGDTCLAPKHGALIYNTIVDRWRTLDAAKPGGDMKPISSDRGVPAGLSVSNSGAQIWDFALPSSSTKFGLIDLSVIGLYLVGVLILGLYFARKNETPDDFFRGGQSIPWWAAACSIYATMLSSLTYLALPALVFRTNWTLLIGAFTIVAVTPIVVYTVMPFFRRINATSAYEYLSLRFNMPIRLFASGLFATFHVGRIGIVLSLTALALAAVTPLEPWQCVLVLGVLSLIYSSLGGVEAVVWTDALQTVVLVVGAIVCIVFVMSGIEGGFPAFLAQGVATEKFKLIEWNFGNESWMVLSFWVIVLGGIGQNYSSYSADQAIIQRYLVTSDEEKAAKAIWLNALVSVPGSLLFFLIGTGLYFFYQSHPSRLDPSIRLDQVFPSFIVNELPVGAAGLVVAGVFAAAQSTVATSMNSVATTLVVDFLRPAGVLKSEHSELVTAKWLTALVGAVGTLSGLLFISPEIRSLMEEYFVIIGMFMGALGGLFLVGMTTTRVGSLGAFAGLFAAVGIMVATWHLNLANGYLFAFIGIVSCYLIASIMSLIIKAPQRDLTNLTVFTMAKGETQPLLVRPDDD